MKHCEKCNVDVTGKRENCPLCQSQLERIDDQQSIDIFKPVQTVYHQYAMFFKIFLFATIAASVVSVAVNMLLPETGLWSIFVVGGLFCVWVSLFIAVRKRRNIPKGLIYQVVIISVFCVIWDLATGWRGWSIDYVFPIMCIATMITIAILAKVLEWKIEHIMVYFIIDSIFGIVPLIFFLTGMLTVPYPSIICVAGSIISIAAIVIFNGGNILSELRRRFNF